MADIKNNLGNIGAMADRPKAAGNRPPQYKDRKNPYFADATSRFVAQYAKYASDYTACRMHGKRATPLIDPSTTTRSF